MSFQDPLFAGVVEWFLNRAGDRRQYRRRVAAFPVRWNDAVGVGADISPNGLTFLIAETIPTNEYDLVLDIADREIAVHVKHVRGDQVEHDGKRLNRYVCEFFGIAADDWDAIARFVNERAEMTNRRQMQNQPMHEKVDDAYRLLPRVLQQKIVAELVAAGRLDAPSPDKSPMLKVFYGGLTRLPGIGVAHRLNAHSRVNTGEGTTAYDTRFVIGENGELKRI